MRDCIFCKIIDGSVPCMKIYEDEHTFSFMDIATGQLEKGTQEQQTFAGGIHT